MATSGQALSIFLLVGLVGILILSAINTGIAKIIAAIREDKNQ